MISPNPTHSFYLFATSFLIDVGNCPSKNSQNAGVRFFIVYFEGV